MATEGSTAGNCFGTVAPSWLAAAKAGGLVGMSLTIGATCAQNGRSRRAEVKEGRSHQRTLPRLRPLGNGDGHDQTGRSTALGPVRLALRQLARDADGFEPLCSPNIALNSARALPNRYWTLPEDRWRRAA